METAAPGIKVGRGGRPAPARSVAEGDQDRDMVGQRDNIGSNLICGLFQNLDPFSVN